MLVGATHTSPPPAKPVESLSFEKYLRARHGHQSKLLNHAHRIILAADAGLYQSPLP